MLTITTTACCSLRQISASNRATSAELRQALHEIYRQGRRAAFVITRPYERALIRRLKGLKFKRTTSFNRCRGYGPILLTMWVKRL